MRDRGTDAGLRMPSEARLLAEMADEFQCEAVTRACDSFLAAPMAMAAIRLECSQVRLKHKRYLCSVTCYGLWRVTNPCSQPTQ